MVKFVNVVRNLYVEMKVEDPITTRVLVTWIEAMEALGDMQEAFCMAHFDALSMEDQSSLLEQYTLVMGEVAGKSLQSMVPKLQSVA
jgi:hypothetical protein